MNLHYKTDRNTGHSFIGSPDQSHLAANYLDFEISKSRFEIVVFDLTKSPNRKTRKYCEAS